MRLCHARCQAFLTRINVVEHLDSHITGPLSRYILGIPYSLPIRHVILGERPYGTRILPYVASAMSFDSDATDSTPSVHYIARDIDNHTDMDYEIAHDWFRDSWKYLKQGVLILNVCTYMSFMDPLSDRERVATEELIRDLIKVSVIISGERVHLCSMGNPAQHSAGRIRSSVPNPKLHVTIHKSRNPAWPSHKKGDQRSPDLTLGGQSVVKYLHGIVSETISVGSYYTITDYIKMSSGGDDIVVPVITQSKKLVDRFSEIEAAFKASPDGKTIDNGENIFRQAKEEVAQFIMVMQSMKTRMMFMNIAEPSGTAKPTYMNARHNYRPQDNAMGKSSRVSSAGSNTPLSVRKLAFADDDSNSDDDTAKKSTTVNTPTSSSVTVPVTATDAFSTPTRKTKGTSTYSAMSHKSAAIGFVAEESEEDSDSPKPPPKTSAGERSSTKGKVNVPATVRSVSSSGSDNGESFAMTNEEMADMDYVCLFIEENEDDDLDPMFVNVLREAVKHRHAQSEQAKDVLKVIREIRANPKLRAVKLALGLVDSVEDMTSPIMQWLLANAVAK